MDRLLSMFVRPKTLKEFKTVLKVTKSSPLPEIKSSQKKESEPDYLETFEWEIPEYIRRESPF